MYGTMFELSFVVLALIEGQVSLLLKINLILDIKGRVYGSFHVRLQVLRLLHEGADTAPHGGTRVVSQTRTATKMRIEHLRR